MTVIYAVEAWVLALLGWGWLIVQESLGFSLLSSHVFLSMIGLSSINVVLVGISPTSKAPRSAYFGALVVLSLYALSCVLDALYTPQLGSVKFEPPSKIASCTLAKTQQLFFFSSSQLFILQGAGLLAYLIIQLIIGGAGMMDLEDQSLWPGAAWGLGLLMMVCCRVFYLFDGSAKGVDDRSRYIQLFSLPVAEIATVAGVLMYVFGVFLGLEGVSFKSLTTRRSLRYISFVIAMVMVGVFIYILQSKGMLTPGLLLLLVIVFFVSIGSLVSAILARDDGARPSPPAPSYPSAPPAQAVFGRYQDPTYPSAPPAQAVFGIRYPSQNRETYPSAPPAQAVYGPGYVGDKLSAAKFRLPIPAPVEMLGLAMEKKKGV
jgi:hypothetical protein